MALTATLASPAGHAETTLPRAEPAPAPPAGVSRPATDAAAPVARATSRAPGLRVRAFFSGHSLLDNPLPDWIEVMARSRGDSLGWQQQIVLGSPIRIRTRGEDPESREFTGYQLGRSRAGGPIDVLSELEHPVQLGPGEHYDYLVIAERPDLIGAMQWEGTIPYLRDFHDRVVRQNPAANTLLYQVWPEIDRRDPVAWIEYVGTELFAWECVAARVNERLAADGRSDRVRVVPAGLALGALVRHAVEGRLPGVDGSVAQRVDAIFKDDLHLTPMAIYLMAAVHYGSLFGKSPRGVAGTESVDPALLAPLQGIAERTLSEYTGRAQQPPTLEECSARIGGEVCPAYHRIHGRAARAERCELWLQPDSPLDGSPPPAASLTSIGWRSGAVLSVIAAIGWAWLRYRRPYPRRSRA